MTLSACFMKDSFWFRVNGKGLSVSWHGRLLFSERNGYEKMIKVGKIKVKLLRA